MSRLPLVALVGLQSHRDLKVGALLSAFETVVVDSPEAAAAPSTGCLAVVLAPSARLQGAVLLDAVARSPIPVLLLCDPVTLDAALDDLGPHADVCLLSAPPRLIERRLKQLLSRTSAMTDALTGAMARGRFLSLVEDRLDAATAATPVSLVVFDLDHFKKRNDDLGHQAGDQLLRQFVRRAKSALGPEDYFARLGGEEFGVCTNADEDTAFELAERVRIACGQTPFDVDTAPVGPQVTVSAGVATASAPCATGEILQAVDEALYAAKAGGRNLCVR